MKKKKTKATKQCVVCGDAHFCRGYCRMHYMRWFRTGDPGGPNKISPSERSTTRLTWDDVQKIRFRVANGKRGTMAAIAKEYDLNPKYVWQIVHNMKWRTESYAG